MRGRCTALRIVLAGLIAGGPVIHPAGGGDLATMMSRSLAAPFKAAHRYPPPAPLDPCVERLASEIDWLEHHVDRHGSIVAKHPDVWGQSRLTRHRDEFEKALADELHGFKELNNASLRRSDQSFLGMALAIDAAATPTTGTRSPTNSVSNLGTITTGTADDSGIVRTKAFTPLTAVKPDEVFGLGSNLVGLEPTIHLDHLARYLNHLHELRRINEGDDIADSPGYALNLVRIPISILPGQYTQRGHGAEVTISVDPQLGADLLPTTFRNLVNNDLVDMLAPPLTFVANEPSVRPGPITTTAEVEEPTADGSSAGVRSAAPEARMLTRQVVTVPRQTTRASFRQHTTTISVPSAKTRRARLPLPGEHVFDVIGDAQVTVLVQATIEALANHPANTPCIEYTDVRGFLQAELEGAQEFLAQPAMAWVWAELPAWNLPAVIRGRRLAELEHLRCRFFHGLGTTSDPVAGASHVEQIAASGRPVGDCDPGTCCNTTECKPLCATTTGALAWMILVESTLLNERLIEDMREAATAKGMMAPAAGPWAGPFFGPDPAPQARQAFNDYVRLRWPVRVFALDPVAQEQNVEDVFALRRETQIAMALAAQGGRANTQAMMRYARRLETDMATIALNKTAVGFSHGSDTFGWRFYPRVQSPPTRNNLVNFAETLVGSNSQRRDLAERRLEPGMRECTAIVVMPSFVPYLNFDIRTNWFSLTDPKHTEQSMRETLRLSRSIKAMQCAATECGQCAGAYRDGEVARMLRRVEQLERELPLQSMLTQIPYENTSGGFEMFNTGITDLAPELIGFYGADGISASEPTTLYIIGKGFSVHDTTMIADGHEVQVELISRQLLKATFPKGPRPGRRPQPPAGCEPQPTGEMSQRQRGRAAGAPARALVTRAPSGRVVLTSGAEPLPSPANPLRGAGLVATGPEPTPRGSDPAFPASGPGVGDNGTGRRVQPGVAGSTFEILAPTAPSPGNATGVAGCNDVPSIDVHLATPYGVSNHLLIPVVQAGGQSTDSPAAGGLALAKAMSLNLFAEKPKDSDTWRLRDHFELDPAAMVISTPQGFMPPANARIHMELANTAANEFTSLSIPAPEFDTRAGVYRLTGADLRNFIGDGSRPSGDATLRGALAPLVNANGGKGGVYTARLSLGTTHQQEPIAGSFTVNVMAGK
jgi:hypothetical protein